jgi:hypothetical protein
VFDPLAGESIGSGFGLAYENIGCHLAGEPAEPDHRPAREDLANRGGVGLDFHDDFTKISSGDPLRIHLDE